MKTVILSQLVLLVLGSLALWQFGTLHNSFSYAAGSGLVFLNFIFLASSWSLVFSKKLIALAVFLIVIKYAILGALLIYCLRQPWLNLTWFAVGVSSFMAAALIYANGQRNHGV